MNISIIGSGWLALPLAKHLTDKGHKVIVTSTSAEKAGLLKTQNFNALVYRIGESLSVELLSADVIVMANTCKNLNAYQNMINIWPDSFKPQIIYTSSTAVYLENGQAHDENSQALNTEHPTYLIEQSLKVLNANVIRLAGLVGPSLIGPARHPGRFFRKTLTIRNPQNPVNLIHLDDVIGVINAVINQQHNSEIFNACADNHPTKGEYYSQMAKLLDSTILDAEQETTSQGKVISNGKSINKLSYSYKYPDVWQMPFH